MSINELVEKIGKDKVIHFLFGAIIVAQFEVFAWYWPLVGVALVFGLSYLKERKDIPADRKDIYYSMAGALAELCSLLIRVWLFK